LRHRRFGFTLVELLLLIGVVAVLAAVTIVAIDPIRNLASSRDVVRKNNEKQLTNAMFQYLIANERLPGDKTLLEGEENKTPICRLTVTDPSCVNFDELVPDYVGELPVDRLELNVKHTGYAAYRQVGRAFAIALYIGQEGGEAPAILTFSPVDDAANVGISSSFVITFDEAITKQTGNVTIKRTEDSSVFEAIDVTSAQISGDGTDTITINPSSELEYDTSYFIEIDNTAFADLASNNFAGISDGATWNFETDIILTDILHRWVFDDGEGTTASDDIGGNDGTLTDMDPGTSWVANVPTGLNVSSALEFFGNTGDKSDRVLLGTPVTLSVNGSSSWAISYWAYQDTNNRVVMGQDGVEKNRIYHRSPSMRNYLDNDEYFSVNYNMNSNKGAWHHVVLLWNGSVFEGYVDGVSYAVAGDYSGGSTSFIIDSIGRAYDNNNNTWDGVLSDIRVYNRVLTPTEISNIAGGKG